MDYTLGTRCDPCTIKIQISSLKPCQLRLQIIDPSLANTWLANRLVMTRTGETHDCYVPLPVSPWQTLIRLSPDSAGGIDGDGYTVVAITKMGLQTYKEAIDWGNKEVRQAIKLGYQFCYNAGWLPTTADDRAYCSPDASLRMRYLPVLIDPKTGKESVTPMRISETTAIMEASQMLCIPFTVAGRAVMYFHEFSHKYENKDPDWELEADLNGLTIYLALGFSRYEALQVYQTVFARVPSEENTKRMVHIERFINNFEHLIKKTS